MQTKSFTADLTQLHAMLQFVQQSCFLTAFPSEVSDKIVLATEEALVNIIHYSYPNSHGKIEISCREEKKRAGLTIFIKDDGVAFNPIHEGPLKDCSLPPLPSLEEKGKKGGYGIYIFVGIMDHVDYKRLENGNFLAMTKYL